MSSIHLVLISAQAVPNITPILDERFRPGRVVMLVSKDMAGHADALERIYRPRGIAVERWAIDDPWDVEHIRNRVMELLTEYEHDDIVLNATGGTKPMSIAAYEVFRSFEKSIFYVHPEQDRLIWMHPNGRPSVDLADRIKLKEYLTSYGASEVESYQGGVATELRQLTDELAADIRHYRKALSALNYYAAEADNAGLRSPAFDASMNGRHDFWRLVELFEHAGLLQRARDYLVFADENARFIANGGWLEFYAYACCLNIKKSRSLQDVGHGVTVVKRAGRIDIKNELDVALLKDNRLHILECKTQRMSDRADTGKADQILYKLDSIRDNLGGLQAKAMLVTTDEMRRHDMGRAGELKVDICSAKDLKNLEDKLSEWIDIRH